MSESRREFDERFWTSFGAPKPDSGFQKASENMIFGPESKCFIWPEIHKNGLGVQNGVPYDPFGLQNLVSGTLLERRIQ